MKLIKTLQSEISNRNKLYLMRNLLVWLEKWISVRQPVLVLFRVFGSHPYPCGYADGLFHLPQKYIKRGGQRGVMCKY